MAKSIQMKDTNNENIYPYALLKEFILYDNTSGSNETITLSDIVSNYNYIEIFYAYGGNYYSSVKVYTPNKLVNLVGCMVNQTAKNVYLAGTNLKINGNKITPEYFGEYQLNGNNLISTTNRIWITRVVGYK